MFLETPPPYLRVWMTGPPPPLSPPYLRHHISYRSALIDEEHFEIPEIFEEFGLCHGQSHQRCTPANKQFANLYLINATACTLCTSLFFFLLFRDDEQEFLPCNKINVGVCTSSGNTALHLASQGGFVKVVEQLLNCRHKW